MGRGPAALNEEHCRQACAPKGGGVMTMQENPTLIVPRRNFLIRALGFTAAGATMPISIITADDAKARMDHHEASLERRGRTTMALLTM